MPAVAGADKSESNAVLVSVFWCISLFFAAKLPGGFSVVGAVALLLMVSFSGVLEGVAGV